MLYLELSAHADGAEKAVHAVAVCDDGDGGVHGVLLDKAAWGGGDDTLPGVGDTLPGGGDESQTHAEEDSAGY